MPSPTPSHSSPLTLITDAQHIEELAYLDMFAAAPEAYVREHQLRTERLAGGTCFAHKGMPMSLFNRVLKVGVSHALTEAQLAENLDWIHRYANTPYNISVDPNAQPEQLPGWLTRAGLHVSGGGIARFYYSGDRVAPAQSPLTVREVSSDERKLAGEVVQAAFGFAPGSDQWFGQLAGRPDWTVYFACDGQTPVGVGALYVKDGLAWLGVGATLPEHRGRGAQRLLLDRRVKDAQAAGVTSIHVETGHPAPGDAPGPSYRNILKAGFEVLFVRDQYMPLVS